jgi:hypothetical protein
MSGLGGGSEAGTMARGASTVCRTLARRLRSEARADSMFGWPWGRPPACHGYPLEFGAPQITRNQLWWEEHVWRMHGYQLLIKTLYNNPRFHHFREKRLRNGSTRTTVGCAGGPLGRRPPRYGRPRAAAPATAGRRSARPCHPPYVHARVARARTVCVLCCGV